MQSRKKYDVLPSSFALRKKCVFSLTENKVLFYGFWQISMFNDYNKVRRFVCHLRIPETTKTWSRYLEKKIPKMKYSRHCRRHTLFPGFLFGSNASFQFVFYVFMCSLGPCKKIVWQKIEEKINDIKTLSVRFVMPMHHLVLVWKYINKISFYTFISNCLHLIMHKGNYVSWDLGFKAMKWFMKIQINFQISFLWIESTFCISIYKLRNIIAD